jgi:hypothetical protein
VKEGRAEKRSGTDKSTGKRKGETRKINKRIVETDFAINFS